MKWLALTILMIPGYVLAQWNTTPTGVDANLRALSVVDTKVMWASGSKGTVLRTIDGGMHWTPVPVPNAATLDFRSLKAISERTAVIASAGKAEDGSARIYRTADGGKNWTMVHETRTSGVFLDCMAFWDAQHGVILSDPVNGRFYLLQTSDGGLTWSELRSDNMPRALPNESAFAASNSCLALGGNSDIWFGTGGASTARIFHSADGGRSWDVSETPLHPSNASTGIFSLAFADGTNGFAVGGDYAAPNTSPAPNLMKTTDGGQTWQAIASSEAAGLYLSSVAVDGNQLIAVGSAGSLISRDGGRHWQRIGQDNLNVLAITGDTALAAGPKGVIARFESR